MGLGTRVLALTELNFPSSQLVRKGVSCELYCERINETQKSTPWQHCAMRDLQRKEKHPLAAPGPEGPVPSCE